MPQPSFSVDRAGLIRNYYTFGLFISDASRLLIFKTLSIFFIYVFIALPMIGFLILVIKYFFARLLIDINIVIGNMQRNMHSPIRKVVKNLVRDWCKSKIKKIIVPN